MSGADPLIALTGAAREACAVLHTILERGAVDASWHPLLAGLIERLSAACAACSEPPMTPDGWPAVQTELDARAVTLLMMGVAAKVHAVPGLAPEYEALRRTLLEMALHLGAGPMEMARVEFELVERAPGPGIRDRALVAQGLN